MSFFAAAALAILPLLDARLESRPANMNTGHVQRNDLQMLPARKKERLSEQENDLKPAFHFASVTLLQQASWRANEHYPYAKDELGA